MLTGLIILAIVYAVIEARRVDERRRRDHRPGPRRREGPQVVGFPCATCNERIIFDSEAVPCEACGKPTHIRCLPHRHDAPAGPYRS